MSLHPRESSSRTAASVSVRTGGGSDLVALARSGAAGLDEADAGINFRDLMMFGRPTGNLRFWWEQGFEATPTFAAVFRPYGFKWFLEGVVRDAILRMGEVNRYMRGMIAWLR